MAEAPIINAELLDNFENTRRILSALKVNVHLSDLESILKQKLNEVSIQIPENAKYTFINFDKIKLVIDSNLESLDLENIENTFSDITFNDELVALTENLSSCYLSLNDKITSFHTSAVSLNEYIEFNRNNINFQTFLKVSFDDLSVNTESLLFILDEIEITIKKILLLGHSIKYKYQNILEDLYVQRFKNESEILFKNFQSHKNKILAETAHQSKRMQSDYESLSSEYSIIKLGIEDFEIKTKDLKKEYSAFERRLQDLANSRSEDIEYVLKEKLIELENTNKVKIEAIDNSYQKAKENYADFTRLVEITGTYVLTENYKNKSNEEKNDYENNRRWTIASICLAILTTVIVIGVPIYEYWEANPPVETNYYTIFARLTISVMFFVLALYTSKQAAKHYECYQENHRTFLQLSALEPFIARMTPEEQKEIRISLIPTLFNQSADGKFASKGDEVGLPESFTTAFEKLIESVKEIKISQNSNKPDGN